MTVTDLDVKRLEHQIEDRLVTLRRLQNPTTRQQYVDLVHTAALETWDDDPETVAEKLTLRLGHAVRVSVLLELAETLRDYERAEDRSFDATFAYDRAEALTCSILAGPSIVGSVAL